MHLNRVHPRMPDREYRVGDGKCAGLRYIAGNATSAILSEALACGQAGSMMRQ